MLEMTAPPLVSHLILDARPRPATERELRRRYKVPAHGQLALCVFEVRLDGYRHYCCWAGGELMHETGMREPQLTLIGRAAVEALVNLPFHATNPDGSLDLLVVQEVIVGATPLQDKVAATLREHRDRPVCFMGDLAGALDGLMAPAFNLTGAPLTVAECAGPGPMVLQ
ncbi:MAG: hypothetical protein ACXWVD_00445 [Telluria sp.]